MQTQSNIEDSFKTRFRRFDAQAKAAARVLAASGTAEWLAIIAGAVALVTAVFTAYQILVDLDDRREERLERNDVRIDRAYDALTRRVGGDSGKGAALSLLIRNSVQLGDIDLSCKAIATWDDERHECDRRAVFSELIAFSPDDSGEGIYNTVRALPKMEYAVISRSDFRQTQVDKNFDGALFADTDLRYSWISAENIKIIGSDFSFGTLRVDAMSPDLIRVNVSGATFLRKFKRDNRNLSAIDLFRQDFAVKGLWYWSDTPPKIIYSYFDSDRTYRLDPASIQGFVECDTRDRLKVAPRRSRDRAEAIIKPSELEPNLIPISLNDFLGGKVTGHSPNCYSLFLSSERILPDDE
jgi:hypothetical protein